MDKNRYTPEGLPIVSPEELEVFYRDLSKRKEEGTESRTSLYVAKVTGQMRHNPQVLDLLLDADKKAALMLRTNPSDDFVRGFRQGIQKCYDLLARAGERINLEEGLGQDP